MEKLRQLFSNPELRKRLLFTLVMLVIYRLGVHVSVPGVKAEALAKNLGKAGDLLNVVDLFSGGAFKKFSIFALGITPYITASIVLQLMGAVVPTLENLQKKEGEAGREKINQWTRYLTVGLAFIQGFGIASLAQSLGPDVVIIPGGDSGRAYLGDSALSGAALRALVSGGKGYFGTCAGAYAAVAHVHGTLDGTTYDYDGWGLAPHVTAQPVGYIGQLPVPILAAGEPILNVSGTLTLMHYRGPAMSASAPVTPLAIFADDKTGFQGAAAIVADALGSGRTILCASHPEVAPRHPELVARMVAWAAFRL